MITIEPIGGLGNQLFIYGIGLANSMRLGVDLTADLTIIRRDQKRKFELPSFANSLSSLEPPPPPKMRWGYQIHRHLSKLAADRGRFRNLHYETVPEFSERFLRVPDGSRLRGYFQSWRYLESVADQLRAEVFQVQKPSNAFNRARNNLRKLGEWTAVHLRRGDFDSLQGMTLSLDYYARALEHLALRSALHPIVVFSDEIHKVSDLPLWDSWNPVLFMSTHDIESPLETMVLMSQASSLIIANSTFSWWAAYLSEGKHRPVIYPIPWGAANHNNRDLCLPSWTGISR